MKILITGVNGFLGSYLRNHLKKRHEIYSISRSGEISSINDYQIDLSNVDYVKENFASIFEQKIDVIIHCAAVLSQLDNKDFNIFNKNNAITESLIHIARIVNATTFINLSTIGVYPNVSGIYDENSKIEPSMNHECLYSLSKVCSEELLKFYLKDIMKVINLRLGQVYGAGMRQDRIFSIMRKELNEFNTITVFAKGQRVSSFVSIDYFIKQIDKILEKDNVQGTFNLGEKNLSYYKLAELIIKEFGNSSSKIILKEDGVNSRVVIDSSKISGL